MMEMSEILELQRQVDEQRLENDLVAGRRKVTEDTLNTQISILSSYMGYVTLGLLYSAFNEEEK